MAGLWCEDFERYPTAAQMLDGLYSAVGSQVSISAANPATGSQHLRVNTNFVTNPGVDNACNFRRILGGTKVTAGLAYHFSIASLPTAEGATSGSPPTFYNLASFQDAANANQLIFVLGTDGAVVAYRGINYASMLFTTLLGRSAPCITANTYQHLEFKVKIDNSTGTLEVRVNGVTVLNLSGIDTQATANAETSQVIMGTGWLLPGGAHADIDNLHTWDTVAGEGPTDFVGNACVIRRTFNADTAIADWAKSTGGTGYTLIGDASDASYISSATVNDKSAFGMANMAANVAGVVYMQLNFRGLKSDSGNCSVAPAFESAGSETLLSAQALTVAQTWRWGILAHDPHTGAAWAKAAADAATVGLKRTL